MLAGQTDALGGNKLTGQGTNGIQVVGSALAQSDGDGLTSRSSILNCVGLAGADRGRGAGKTERRSGLSDNARDEGESANDSVEEAHGG